MATFEFEDEGRLSRAWDWACEHLGLWRLETMFRDWVFPGHHLRNLLFRRYDRVKAPQVRAWEYCDPCRMMFYCPFEILRRFVDEEKPFEVVEFYGDCAARLPDGTLVGDEIKELYHWYVDELPALERDILLISEAWCARSDTKLVFHRADEEGYGKITMEHDAGRKRREITEEQAEAMRRRFGEAVEDGDEISRRCDELDSELERARQRNLRRLVEIRDYLWT